MDSYSLATPAIVSNRTSRGFWQIIASRASAFGVNLRSGLAICLGVGLLLTATTIGFGQMTSGDLTGTVRDPSGAVIVKATVLVTNEETGVASTVYTGTA